MFISFFTQKHLVYDASGNTLEENHCISLATFVCKAIIFPHIIIPPLWRVIHCEKDQVYRYTISFINGMMPIILYSGNELQCMGKVIGKEH